MRAREHALEMTEGVHHCDNVILDITKIKANFHPWGDLVIFIATLRKAFEHVSLATEQTHQVHDVLANMAKSGQEWVVVFIVRSSTIDIIIQRVCGILTFSDGRTKVVDDIVTVSRC